MDGIDENDGGGDDHDNDHDEHCLDVFTLDHGRSSLRKALHARP